MPKAPSFSSLLLLGLCFRLPLMALPPFESFNLQSSDGVRIAADWYHGPSLTGQVIVISPGFAQYKSSRSMQGVLQSLAPQSDLLIFDYRGNGMSGGEYWFGSKEILDLNSVLDFARTRYQKIKLLGFSLGAYSALRAASEAPARVDELYLASCPISVNDIVWTGGFLLNPICLPFQNLNSKLGDPQNDFFFRWGPIFAPKPSGLDLAAALKTPVSFLSGGRDRLVFQSRSRMVFEKVPGRKSWTFLEEGLHAEAMFLEKPDFCAAWMAKEAGE